MEYIVHGIYAYSIFLLDYISLPEKTVGSDRQYEVRELNRKRKRQNLLGQRILEVTKVIIYLDLALPILRIHQSENL